MRYINKILMLAGCAAIAAGMTGCKEEPTMTSSKAFSQSFEERFGTINPLQDWKMCKTSYVYVNANGHTASQIFVYIHECGAYHLVSKYSDVDRDIILHVETPMITDELILDIDGTIYTTAPGGEINLGELPRQLPLSRDDDAVEHGAVLTTEVLRSAEPLGWILAIEDLGDTDDFDFNDVLMRIEYTNVPGKFALQVDPWTVIDNGIVGAGLNAPSRDGTTTYDITITPLAAGGTIAVWLHYLDYNKNNYIISKKATTDDSNWIAVGSVNGYEDDYEWHMNFDVSNTTTMINTGNGTVTKSVPKLYIKISEQFSFEYYSESTTSYNSSTKTTSAQPAHGFYISLRDYKDENNNINATTGNGTVSAPLTGKAPQMFLIPDIGYSKDRRWAWPKERVQINTVYTYFESWVKYNNGTDTSGDYSTYHIWFTETIADSEKVMYPSELTYTDGNPVATSSN